MNTISIQIVLVTLLTYGIHKYRILYAYHGAKTWSDTQRNRATHAYNPRKQLAIYHHMH